MKTIEWSKHASIISLACVAGIAVSSALYGIDYGSRMTRIARETAIARLERSIRIQSYDPSRHEIYALMTETMSTSSRPIVLHVSTSTNIIVQSGTVIDGVTTHINPAVTGSPADLVGGRKALASFVIRDDGTLAAMSISLDNPLAQD